MIRHIVALRLNGSATPERVARIRSELAALDVPGRVAFTMGPDLGLRAGNLDLALVADFDDVESYRAYDADPEHDRIRRELIAPIAERVERCQFEL
jgi:hypothetical protein